MAVRSGAVRARVIAPLCLLIVAVVCVPAFGAEVEVSAGGDASVTSGAAAIARMTSDEIKAALRKVTKAVLPNSKFTHPTLFRGKLFFNLNDDAHGHELWESDLTEAGTRLVKDIWPGKEDGYPHSLAVFRDALYFSADDGVAGKEVWRSDGTAAGTVLLKDVRQGSEHSYAQSLAGCESAGLFFGADDGEHGFELWRSDGSTEGTKMLIDITKGSADSALSSLECDKKDGLLKFMVEQQHWVSDGTVFGTKKKA